MNHSKLTAVFLAALTIWATVVFAQSESKPVYEVYAIRLIKGLCPLIFPINDKILCGSGFDFQLPNYQSPVVQALDITMRAKFS